MVIDADPESQTLPPLDQRRAERRAAEGSERVEGDEDGEGEQAVNTESFEASAGGAASCCCDDGDDGYGVETAKTSSCSLSSRLTSVTAESESRSQEFARRKRILPLLTSKSASLFHASPLLLLLVVGV